MDNSNSTAPAVPPNLPHDDKGPTMNGVGWTLTVLSTVFVVARLYTRAKLSRNLGWDDALVAFSLLLALATASMCSVAVSHGYGQHPAYLTPAQAQAAGFWAAILQPFVIAGTTIGRVAIAALLTRVFGTPLSKGRRRSVAVGILWAANGILIVASLLCILAPYVQCQSFFNGSGGNAATDTSKSCMPEMATIVISFFQGAWSAVVDLLMSIFPLTFLWHLKIKKSKKIGVAILMGLGILAMLCAIIRTVQFPDISSPDSLYATWTLFLLTIIENNIILVVACMPTLSPLYLKLRGRQASGAGKSSDGSSRRARGGVPGMAPQPGGWRGANGAYRYHSDDNDDLGRLVGGGGSSGALEEAEAKKLPLTSITEVPMRVLTAARNGSLNSSLKNSRDAEGFA